MLRRLSFKLSCFVFGLLLSTVTSLMISTNAQAGADSRFRQFKDFNFEELDTKDFRILTPEVCRADYARYEFETRDANDNAQKALQAAEPNGGVPTLAMLEWSPSGAPDRQNRADCSAQTLEERILSTASQPRVQAQEIKKFFARCEGHLTRSAPSTYFALLHLANSRYPVCENPSVRKVIMRLSDGAILRGFIAMKPGAEKRPLIILRCGIMCNAGDLSHRFMLMHLFDESPFNVLAIGNVTGADFVRDNGFMAIGGLDEGQQFMRLIRQIREMPLGKYVSTIHVSGISLGGQGALYASYMSPYNKGTDEFAPITSTLALCPVVDLQASMNDLFARSWKGRIAKWAFLREVYRVITSVPILGELFPDLDPVSSRIPGMVAEKAVAHYSTLNNWTLPPFEGDKIASTQEFWERNQFIKRMKEPVRTPTLVFASDDDIMVATRDNSGPLAEALRTAPPSDLSVVTVKRGAHCAFGVIQGWDVTSSLFRGYFLSRSPDLLARKHTLNANFPSSYISYWSRLWKDSETHHLQRFEFAPDQAVLKIHFRIFSRYQKQSKCYFQDETTADIECFRDAVSEVPFEDIRLTDGSWPEWAHVPRNETEAQTMSRWANRNMSVTDSKGRLLNGRAANGGGLTWTSYEAR